MISIVHWSLHIPIVTASTSVIGPWLSTYPLVGLCTIFYYYTVIPDVVYLPMKQAMEDAKLNRLYDVKSIVNDEALDYDVDKEGREAREKSCLKNFFFGPQIAMKDQMFRVENVCESAAIFEIKRSWERQASDTPILSPIPEKMDGSWKEPATEEAEVTQELEFLNACYRNVKKKMKAEKERGRKQGQDAAKDDQELDEALNLPEFNG